jgi:hypothetical protein
MIRNSCVFWICDLYFLLRQLSSKNVTRSFLLISYCYSHTFPWGAPYMFSESTPEAEFLGWNPSKSLKSFPPCYSHSYSFYSSVSKEKRGKPMVSEIHTETSTLRTLKIMPRNLKEILSSWIRLQIPACVGNFVTFAYRGCGESHKISQQATPRIKDIRRVGDSLYRHCGTRRLPVLLIATSRFRSQYLQKF